jgi:hypothetical protein
MPDGTYLELVSFTHPESHYPPSSPSHDARRNHPWANKPSGWLAYAFLGAPHTALPLSAVLNTRLEAAGSDTRYEPEVPGGRTRPDGVEIKWEITTPTRWGEKKGTSRLPFFCGDVTPRELRVRGCWSPHRNFFTRFAASLLGTDSAKIDRGSPERRAGHRTSASARSASNVRVRLCRAHGDIGRGAN